MRLLPLTMLVAFLLLGLKVGEVMRDGERIAVSFEEAHAQPATPAATSSTATAAPAAATKTAAPAGSDTAAKKDDASKPASGDEETEEEELPQAKHEYTPVEVDLLQSLAKRRQELDEWAKQVQLKENMLIATEQRVNEKIDSLQKMKKEIEGLLAQYNEQEDTKIRSLVKIYENMKPKDAARIFEELDMPVLLTVVDRMNERKVAPILANMNPQKAKDLTVQLAEQHKLHKPGVASAAAAAAAPLPATSPTGR